MTSLSLLAGGIVYTVHSYKRIVLEMKNVYVPRMLTKDQIRNEPCHVISNNVAFWQV